jgi:ribosome modulation factor
MEKLSNLSFNVSQFLGKWTTGSNRALYYYNSNPRIATQLKKTVDRDVYLLFRGVKCTDEDAVIEKFGVPIEEITKGKKMVISLGTIHSWTKDSATAYLFSDCTYDTVEHKYHTGEDYDNVGIEPGDELGYGVVVVARIPKDKIMADLSNIDDKYLSYEDEVESEVITLPGEFEVEIMRVDKYECPDYDLDDDDDDDWDNDDDDIDEDDDLDNKVLVKRDGIASFEQGISRDDCPYDDHDDIAIWQSGWDISKNLDDKFKKLV